MSAKITTFGPLWDLRVTFLLLFGFSDVVQTLRLHRLDIPRTAYVGDSLWLNCSYDLESDDFYAVKWYFNNTEFYSYSNNKPDFFEPPGIHIDQHISLEGNVFLQSVSLQAEGVYKCEVTAGRPTFQTVAQEQFLEVYMMPTTPPAIKESTKEGLITYALGDVINVNCTSPLSKPATRLNWRINDKPVPASALIPYAPLPGSSGLQYSHLGLRIKLEPPIVNSGDSYLRLACDGEVRRERQIERQVKVISPRGTSPADSNPKIAYVKQQDMLNATCTVRDTNEASHVTWILNGRKLDSDSAKLVTFMRTRPSLSIQSELSVQLSRADRERPLLRCVAIQAYTLWNGTNVRERKIHTRSAGFFYINGATQRASPLISMAALMTLIQAGVDLLTQTSLLQEV
ncbi:uncharacterized protein LOC111267555 [Varroa jacobsoni]|uniref:Ig-like domain-containing protein n=1 Tax=Varroa destructor TaxID=109461 RepID=A0A7M7J4D4_VARDE|nr:uncharacterized protein LOC111244170 [Varroa destructor]XP_022701566.1 uncharacterized protein LOC111267555 [Varroa jacobsoni]